MLFFITIRSTALLAVLVMFNLFTAKLFFLFTAEIFLLFTTEIFLFFAAKIFLLFATDVFLLLTAEVFFLYAAKIPFFPAATLFPAFTAGAFHFTTKCSVLVAAGASHFTATIPFGPALEFSVAATATPRSAAKVPIVCKHILFSPPCPMIRMAFFFWHRPKPALFQISLRNQKSAERNRPFMKKLFLK